MKNWKELESSNGNKFLLRVSELNNVSRNEFVRAVGRVFEESPWIAEETWIKRPFGNLCELHGALCETVRRASVKKQLALICAHPDLVGRAALAGTLSPESNREQTKAGLAKLTADEVGTFQRLNQKYRERFGFPFVICARLNKKDAILDGFRVRLDHSLDEEMKAALEEIYKIAYLRLQDIVTSE